jgi:phosphoglycolate phosphatase
MKTILWDIDGTLLSTNGAGATPFKRAIEECLGKDIDFRREEYAGLTDHQIANLHLRQFANSENYSEVLSTVISSYADGLEKVLVAEPAQPYPRIMTLLDQLAQYDEYQLAVVTGNCDRGAAAKLKSANLLRFFHPNNIFCSTGLQARSEIVSKAIVQLNLKVDDAIVVGDTIRDFEGARACGLFSIILSHTETASWANSHDKYVAHLGPNWSPALFLETLTNV